MTLRLVFSREILKRMKTKILLIPVVVLLLALSACSKDSGGGESGTPVVDTNPITVATPTPTPADDPGEDPTPTPTPTSTPTPTPTPVPTTGDWNQAVNLAQSIYDVSLTRSIFSYYKIKVSYYDIDHLSTNPSQFSKSVTFNANFYHPGLNQYRISLKGSDSQFDGSSVDCNADCSKGTINLVFKGKVASRLDGIAAIQFFRKGVYVGHLTKGTGGKSSLEKRLVDTFNDSSQKVVSAFAVSFQVVGGFVAPYHIDLLTSCDGNYPAQHTMAFRGRKLGESVEVKAHYEDELYYYDGSLGLARVRSDGSTNLGICFKDTSKLQSFGVSTSSTVPDPCL